MSESGWSGANLARMLNVTGDNARRVNDIAVAATAVAAAAGASGLRTYRETRGSEFSLKIPGTTKKLDLRLLGAGLALIPGLVKPSAGITPYTHAIGAGLLASYAIETVEDKATVWGQNAIAKEAAAAAATAPVASKGIVIGKLSPEERREKRLGRRVKNLSKRLAKKRSELASAHPGTGQGQRVVLPSAGRSPAPRRISADPIIANRAVTPAEYAAQYNRRFGR